MTLPPASKCMECHHTIGKDKPDIQRLAEFAQSIPPLLIGTPRHSRLR